MKDVVRLVVVISVWKNTFFNSDKYIKHFRQIHYEKEGMKDEVGGRDVNLDKYIFQFRQIRLAF